MSEQNKPFVINDRRKFTSEGELRPDVEISEQSEPQRTPAATAASPAPKTGPIEFKSPNAKSEPAPPPPPVSEPSAADMPPAPTEHEMEQANAAYQQTAERLETAVRAANPGIERPPAMDFSQIVQSVYMTTLLQLGGAAPEGQPPKVDLMGARQSIDMLSILADKSKGNLNPGESRLLDSALFELRMGFLEVTQALARSAARQPVPPPPGSNPTAGPKIVR